MSQPVIRLNDFNPIHRAILVYGFHEETPDLRADVMEWLRKSLPDAEVFADPATDYGVSIRFANETDAKLFSLFWLGG